MLKVSEVDRSHSPPKLQIPRHYNAAHDLIERNLRPGIADKPAFIDDQQSLTYRELECRTSAFANLLRSLGVEMEQRVLLCMHDTVDFPVVFLGSIKAGAIPVPVNTLLTAQDYAYLLHDCRARVAVVSASLWPLIEPSVPTLPCLRHVLISGGDMERSESLTRQMAGASTTFDTARTSCDDACFWLYSSGSTGPPKGTVHLHSSLIQTAELYARPILGLDETDVCFSAAKLFFAYGLGNSLTFPLAAGATAILMAERATPAAVFARLTRHRPSIFGGVPTLYANLLANPELGTIDGTCLRRCISAGEPLPADIGHRWRRRFGVDILDGIGSTEMLHIFLSNRPDDVQYGTTGLPVPGYSIRIVDELGAPVPPGEQGELHVSGPSSAAFYWNNRERSRSTFLGAWTRTGDQYFQRADGHFVYVGRGDDMLKVSGIYVSPAEVEATLVAHEAVLEAAVIGCEDSDGLIKPKGYVVLRPGVNASQGLSAELQRHVKSRLAPYKYPRWIEFLEELPKTATGKIQRFKLRSPSRSPARANGSNNPVQRLTVAGRSLEYQLVRSGSPESPTLVFLHEGLGSISLWKDFPERLAAACGCNALVYSRYGNGFSEVLAEPRPIDYMHREALVVLPELLQRLSIRNPILFGHSDGGSIALLHEGMAPGRVRGMVLLAPHVFVEALTVENIYAAKLAYESTDLRTRLGRHHADVDRTFWGWNNIWLHEDFRRWTIEECLASVRCPVLAMQGVDDEYGTFEQIDRIATRAAAVELHKLGSCRHSPHRDQPAAVIDTTVNFVKRLAGGLPR